MWLLSADRASTGSSIVNTAAEPLVRSPEDTLSFLSVFPRGTLTSPGTPLLWYLQQSEGVSGRCQDAGGPEGFVGASLVA